MKPLDRSAILGLLPAPLRFTLEQLTASLQQALGDRLAAIVAHGSIVRGGWVAGRSDVDLIVVVRGAPRASLEAIGPTLQLARAQARIECMILDEAELAGAADVFPLLYDDVRAAHVALVGGDPFAGLHIADEHRRLRIEQELRDARIRLRRTIVDAAGHPDGLAGPVQRKLKRLRSPLQALLVLRGEAGRDDVETVYRRACRSFGVDELPLLRAREAPGPALDALAALLDRAIAAVDAHVIAGDRAAAQTNAATTVTTTTAGGAA